MVADDYASSNSSILNRPKPDPRPGPSAAYSLTLAEGQHTLLYTGGKPPGGGPGKKASGFPRRIRRTPAILSAPLHIQNMGLTFSMDLKPHRAAWAKHGVHLSMHIHLKPWGHFSCGYYPLGYRLIKCPAAAADSDQLNLARPLIARAADALPVGENRDANRTVFSSDHTDN